MVLNVNHDSFFAEIIMVGYAKNFGTRLASHFPHAKKIYIKFWSCHQLHFFSD